MNPPSNGNRVSTPRFLVSRTSIVLCVLSVLVVFGLVLAFSSIYIVHSEEIGLVVRFGEYREAVAPGLQFKAPLFIDKVYRLPVGKPMELHFGSKDRTPPGEAHFQSTPMDRQQVFLSADLKQVAIEWTTTYRISDPVDFLFKNRNVLKVFEAMNEATVQVAASGNPAINLSSNDRTLLGDQIKKRLQIMCDQYETGIRIVRVEVDSFTEYKPTP